MKRTLVLAIFAFLSFNVVTAAVAETVQTKQTGKPAAAQPAATKSEVETSVLLNAPLFSRLFQDVPVASVEDEIIPLRELNETLFSLHEGNKEDTQTASKVDYKVILDRLINMTLITIEARDMGLDQEPKIQDDIKKNADGTLRGMLKDRQIKDIVPDKDVVERYYKQAVKEWKIRSVIFTKEEDAKKMAAGLKGGKDFNELVKKALADKTAKGGEEGQYLKLDKVLPGVASEVQKLKAGEVTPVIKVAEGYTIIKAEDIRYPEDASARKDAEAKATETKAQVVLREYFASLKKKYVVINTKLFKSLNFESSPAKFEKLLSDKRILIKIKDEKPITVGQYTEALDTKFFHGIERAILEKKVNVLKDDVLSEILARMLFLREAKALGIDKTDEYKDSQARFKRSVLFGVFIQKVVMPDIKISEGENKKYYEEHISDYTTPEMLKLYSLAFYKVKDAADTLKKLQQGADFKWLKSNASGQIKDDEPNALSFDGDVFTITGLDEALRKTLTGAKTGDYRLYSDGKFSYVINIREDTPSQKQTYVEAREATAQKVYKEKLNQSVQDWAAKLRQAHKVKVYITGIGTTTE